MTLWKYDVSRKPEVPHFLLSIFACFHVYIVSWRCCVVADIKLFAFVQRTAFNSIWFTDYVIDRLPTSRSVQGHPWRSPPVCGVTSELSSYCSIRLYKIFRKHYVINRIRTDKKRTDISTEVIFLSEFGSHLQVWFIFKSIFQLCKIAKFENCKLTFFYYVFLLTGISFSLQFCKAEPNRSEKMAS